MAVSIRAEVISVGLALWSVSSLHSVPLHGESAVRVAATTMSSTAEKNDLKSSSSSTTSADEKGRVNEVERAVSGDEQARKQPYNAHIDVSGVDEKKLLRKLDLWLVPWLSFLYLLSFLDRTSIGNAKVSLRGYQHNSPLIHPSQLYGLETDLGINDTQYNIALTIFFFSYAIFEVSLLLVLIVIALSIEIA